jgi:hypothetical protein
LAVTASKEACVAYPLNTLDAKSVDGIPPAGLSYLAPHAVFSASVTSLCVLSSVKSANAVGIEGFPVNSL